MDHLLKVPAEPRTAADDQAAIERMLVEMDRINEKMATDREEIERLRVESRRLRDETRAILTDLGAAL